MINIYEHRKTCIFLCLEPRETYKSLLKFSKNLSCNFTSCCWEPCTRPTTVLHYHIRWRCFLHNGICFQIKEKNQTKSLMQNPPASTSEAVPGYKSPPTLSAMSAVAETTSPKTTAGKFTTANFIETTIQPSPANFGSVGGAVTTVATSVVSTTSTTIAVQSTISSVTVSSEAVTRSPTSSYGPKMSTAQSSTSPSSGGLATKSSVTTTSPTTSSAATFSNTFQNFVGQNYAAQLDPSPADLPTLSSPELPRGKKRQTKLVLQMLL